MGEDKDKVVATKGEELLDCPDCGGNLTGYDYEPMGNGVVIREIECLNCGFLGEESFQIQETIRQDDSVE